MLAVPVDLYGKRIIMPPGKLKTGLDSPSDPEVHRKRYHRSAGLPGLTFPVDFHIPFECRETDEPDSGSKIIWRLEASAQVAGIDYRTQFEAPVFKTPESSPEPPEEGAFTFRSEVKKEFDPKTATIAVRPSPGGGTEYFFPAARNVGAALSVTTFLLIFAGAIWLQLHLLLGSLLGRD